MSGVRRLVLMRHGKAADAGPQGGDADRPLTPRGRRDAETAGVLLAGRQQVPELALVSTAVRTRETWAALRSGFGAGLGGGVAEGPEVWFDRALYDSGPPAVVELLAAVEPGVSSVLVVGHNPAVSIVAAALSDGQGRPDLEALLEDGMPTAAMACFDVPVSWADVNARRLRLTAVDVPRG